MRSSVSEFLVSFSHAPITLLLFGAIFRVSKLLFSTYSILFVVAIWSEIG